MHTQRVPTKVCVMRVCDCEEENGDKPDEAKCKQLMSLGNGYLK